MCGRFAQVLSRFILEVLYKLDNIGEPENRYNIAPSQYALLLRLNPLNNKRELVRLQWGFLPAWVGREQKYSKPINARVETAERKPYFREAFRRRRALIPVSGYYEWQRSGPKKQPYYIHDKEGRPLSLAGLWERWEQGEQVKETFVILTTEAKGRLAKLHHRMPLILPETAFDCWLSCPNKPDALRNIIRSTPLFQLDFYPVSPLVNNPANDNPACLQPIR